MIALAGALALALGIAAPADITGKWAGTITSQGDDGRTNEDAALLILEQKDTAITGTIGGSDDDQHPIVAGKIDGNKVMIVAQTANGREFRLELTVEGDEMKGSVETGNRKGQLHLRRRTT